MGKKGRSLFLNFRSFLPSTLFVISIHMYYVNGLLHNEQVFKVFIMGFIDLHIIATCSCACIFLTL